MKPQTVKKADWIQERVAARVAELGLSSYAVAKLTADAGTPVSEDHVRDYLTRRHTMASWKLQHVLHVLGLTVEVAS